MRGIRFVCKTILACPLVWGCGLEAQILDRDRVVDWTPGIPGGMPVKTAEVDVRDFGAVGDSLSDEAPAFASAIASLPAGGGTVRIPAGRYLLRRGLRLDRGIVLSGEGFRDTRLTFDLEGRSENAVEISRPVEDGWTPLRSGAPAGGLVLETENAGRFSPGDFLEITRDNDPDLMYTKPWWNEDWAANAVGQIVRVASVERGRIRTEAPLLLDYPAGLNARLRRLDPVLYAGVERLSLLRLDDGRGDMILLKHAAFCRISGVESAFTTGIHVFLHTAYGCEVTAGYFHHSHGYGDGGRGYGVDCATHSTANRIENNILVHLRHALVAQVGACGNVFGYNCSTDPVSDENLALADLVLHGHYGHHNLFEGNVVQRIGVADYWGPAGPGNVFLRNVVEAGEVNVEDFSHGQIFIGNRVRSGSGEGIIRINPSVRNTLLHGNRIGDSVQWDPGIPSRDIPFSYYLDGKPAFWGDLDWPFAAGTDSHIPESPSQRRLQENGFISPDGRSRSEEVGGLSIYPNPAGEPVHVRFFIPRSCDVSLTLADMRGRTLRRLWRGFLERGLREWTLDFGEAGRPAHGIYVLVVTMGRLRMAGKITLL